MHSVMEPAIGAIVDWYNADGGAIVLMGGCGCGKTHIARRILIAAGGPYPFMEWEEDNKRWVTVHNAVFYAEPDLLADIRASYSSDGESADRILYCCRTTKLLILDDIGVGYVKPESQPWYEDIMWRVLDDRAERNLKTMVTTNLGAGSLKVRLGMRAFSRLRGMVGSQVHIISLFDVPDYRGRGW